MKVSGADFMRWYDQWAVDPDSDGLVWENDNSVATLHSEKGEWLLDPDRIYILDELGEIQREDGCCVDTEAVYREWSEGRSMAGMVVPAGLTDDRLALAVFKAGHSVFVDPSDSVLSVERRAYVPTSQSAYGIDIIHFLDTLSEVYDGPDLKDRLGRWRLGLSDLYRISDLIELEDGDVDDRFSDYLENREARPVFVYPRDTSKDLVFQAPAWDRIPPAPSAGRTNGPAGPAR